VSGAVARSLIAVDGIDGSGKSVFADRLAAAAAEVGIGAVVVSIDDFRRPVDWRQPERSEADIYYDEYFDLPLLDRCLLAFEEGAPSVQIPIFDPASERFAGQRTIFYGAAVLAIVEGVFTLRVSALSARASLVHLRTSFPEARRRIVVRDTARGRSIADVRHRIAARYFPCQERYHRDLDPAGRADVIVDNEKLDSPRVERFDRSRLGPLLAAAFSRITGSFARGSAFE
jgi:uridine kinase